MLRSSVVAKRVLRIGSSVTVSKGKWVVHDMPHVVAVEIVGKGRTEITSMQFGNGAWIVRMAPTESNALRAQKPNISPNKIVPRCRIASQHVPPVVEVRRFDLLK
jgi:hypothetical protein